MNEQNNNLNNGINNIPNQQPMNNQQPVMSQQNVQPNANPVVNEFNSNVQYQQPVMPQQNVNPVVNEFNSNTQYQQPVNNQPKKKNKFLLPLIIGISVFVVTLVVVLIVLLGGNKTLNCTRTETNSGMEMKMDATISFKSKKVSSAKVSVVVDLGNYASYKDVFINSFKEEYEKQAKDGIKVNITSDDSHVYINMEASRDNYDVLGFVTAKDYNEAKKELEADGFTCK